MKAIYARQSIERQDSVSIQAQIDQCYKAINNAEAVIYKDVGFSGKNINRPEFEKLISDIKNDKISTVVSYRLDRISRSIVDFANLLTLFEKHNVQYISATEQFDTSTPMGRAMIYIVMVFAQLERETIAGRVQDNYRFRSKSGQFMGGNTPFGYCSTKIMIEGKKTPVLVPDENVDLLKKIFSMYVTDKMPFQAMARSLNADGYLTAKGKLWTSNAIKRILSNISPVAADELLYDYLYSSGYDIANSKEDFTGQFGMCIFFKNKNRNEQTDIKSQIACIGLHQPIITSAEFIAAQQQLNNDNKVYTKRSQQSPLSGLLKCAECGFSFGLKSTTRKNKNYSYYYCRSRHSRGLCENNLYISADELENYIVTDCKNYLSALIESNVKADKVQPSVPSSEETDIINQMNNIINNIGKGNTVVNDLLTAKLTNLQARLDELRTNKLQTIGPAHSALLSLQADLKKYNKLTIDKKATLLRSIISSVHISNDSTIEIIYSI